MFCYLHFYGQRLTFMGGWGRDNTGYLNIRRMVIRSWMACSINEHEFVIMKAG